MAISLPAAQLVNYSVGNSHSNRSSKGHQSKAGAHSALLPHKGAELGLEDLRWAEGRHFGEDVSEVPSSEAEDDDASLDVLDGLELWALAVVDLDLQFGDHFALLAGGVHLSINCESRYHHSNNQLI